MKEKSIKDIVDKMTEEEKDLHRHLIVECVNREYEVNKHSKITAQNFKKLTEITYKMQGDFKNIQTTLNNLNLQLTKTAGGIH